MNLKTPEKIRSLQRALYVKAKQEPQFRFYLLYDKVCRMDILEHAWRQCRARRGSPGVDGVTFEFIESSGVAAWLAALQKELQTESYKPAPVKRVLIPKPGGGERPLGIPTIRDRVVQAAAKIVLEPIFESTFDPAAYGYRPERNAVDAVEVASDALRAGRTQVIDADLSKYFDTIPHHELLTCLAKRIIDRKVLHLIKMWLKVPIEETDERGNKRMTGGKRSTRGTPQGGVISPLLANIYIHRFIRAFRLFGLAEKFGAILSNYADDFVVLCRHGAHAALNRIDDWLTRIGLTLNREKTSVKNVWKQSFDYLGYTLGVRYSGATKRRYLGVLPSQKSREQFRARVRSSLRSANFRPVAEVVDRLNRILRGWGNYFNYGEIVRLRRGMDWYTMERVRDHLRRRHKVAGRGTRRFSRKYIRDTLGLVTLEAMPRRRLTHACT